MFRSCVPPNWRRIRLRSGSPGSTRRVPARNGRVVPGCHGCRTRHRSLALAGDLDRCLDEFERGKVDAVITVTDANRSPDFNMVRIRRRISGWSFHQPVGGPAAIVAVVYDIDHGVLRRPTGLRRAVKATIRGSHRSVHIPVERALDIDTLLDFRSPGTASAGATEPVMAYPRASDRIAFWRAADRIGPDVPWTHGVFISSRRCANCARPNSSSSAIVQNSGREPMPLFARRSASARA